MTHSEPGAWPRAPAFSLRWTSSEFALRHAVRFRRGRRRRRRAPPCYYCSYGEPLRGGAVGLNACATLATACPEMPPCAWTPGRFTCVPARCTCAHDRRNVLLVLLLMPQLPGGDVPAVLKTSRRLLHLLGWVVLVREVSQLLKLLGRVLLPIKWHELAIRVPGRPLHELGRWKVVRLLLRWVLLPLHGVSLANAIPMPGWALVLIRVAVVHILRRRTVRICRRHIFLVFGCLPGRLVLTVGL